MLKTRTIILKSFKDFKSSKSSKIQQVTHFEILIIEQFKTLKILNRSVNSPSPRAQVPQASQVPHPGSRFLEPSVVIDASVC